MFPGLIYTQVAIDVNGIPAVHVSVGFVYKLCEANIETFHCTSFQKGNPTAMTVPNDHNTSPAFQEGLGCNAVSSRGDGRANRELLPESTIWQYVLLER